MNRIRGHPRILMCAYYCSPAKGSDWRVGFGRVLAAASRFQVFVLTGEHSRADIEEYCRIYGEIPNVRFFYVDSGGGGWLSRIPKSFLYVNPFQYADWQRRALALARELHGQYRFDLVHHVTLVGYRQPGCLYKLGVPFIWGPIGGTQDFPFRFLPGAGFRGAIQEGARSLVNAVQIRYSRKVRQAMRHAAVVLAANSECERAIRKHYGRNAVLLLETGIDAVRPKSARDPGEELRVLWSGDLSAHKALHLLFRALSSIREQVRFSVRILGTGARLERLRAEARRLGIDEVCEFTGFLPLDRAMAQSEWADVFVFTSLRDTSGNVMLEAMSRGVPVICFDHQGAHDIVTDTSGIRIPLTSPAAAVQELARAIKTVADDRPLLSSLGAGALRRAEDYLWSNNNEQMGAIYEKVLLGHGNIDVYDVAAELALRPHAGLISLSGEGMLVAAPPERATALSRASRLGLRPPGLYAYSAFPSAPVARLRSADYLQDHVHAAMRTATAHTCPVMQSASGQGDLSWALPGSGDSPEVGFAATESLVIGNTNKAEKSCSEAIDWESPLTSPAYLWLKRLADIACAGAFCALAMPVLIALAMAVWLDRSGPVLFSQTRIGRNGRRFLVWKFRSMVSDSGRVLAEYLSANPDAAAEWAATQKLRLDPRITAVGRFLRSTSLDELPQLWNILLGHMSLVGPRPIVDAEVRRYGEAIGYYLQVRPGLTGLWQVSGRNNTTYDERVTLDSDYVRTWSVWLDFYILLKTVRVVLCREGAY
jgi:lipopolysaccharide/colanic/teichoic acid biosynthesis glycosyltransferase/glycosyltransferase involved in cell wall biosynthesis